MTTELGNQTGAPHKILVVDDEKTTRSAICEALTRVGYLAKSAESADEALNILEYASFDVVILDLNMPGKHHGLDVLQAAEKLAPDTAFIILTGQPSTETAITALRSGAFDYLRKPVTLKTIFDRAEAAIKKQTEQRRQKHAVSLLQQALTTLQMPIEPQPSAPLTTFRVGAIVIDDQKKTAAFQGTDLDLTPIEYKLLLKFVQEPDTILSYAELAAESHDMDLEESEARALLRTHIYRLSRKFGDKDETPLQNVRGQGVILRRELA